MTSAPNHRQPLSGNKKAMGYILLSLYFFLASCASTRKPVGGGDTTNKKTEPKTETTSPSEPKKKEEAKTTPPPPSRKARRQEEDSLDRVYPITLKEKYSVALILPLYLRHLELSKVQKSTAGLAVDFYRGAWLAADTLRNCGLSLDLH